MLVLSPTEFIVWVGWKEPKRSAITYFGHCSREVETDYCT
jgi:hypothetical protein